MSTRTMNGSFFASEHPSIWRQGPSPIVDRAWQDLLFTSTILISSDDVRRLGKDPSHTVRAPLDWGYGPDAHLAQIDSQHQLHCLDMLRRAVYREYYYPASDTFSLKHWTHLSHCVDILRQNLVCQANVDLHTYNWVKTQRYPYPDFGIKHQCRDHGAVVEWLKEKGTHVERDVLLSIKKPAGIVELPIPDDYWDVFGVEREDQAMG